MPLLSILSNIINVIEKTIKIFRGLDNHKEDVNIYLPDMLPPQVLFIPVQPSDTSLYSRLSVDGESLYRLGFQKVVFVSVGNGYGTLLDIDKQVQLAFYMPPGYPYFPPTILLRHENGALEEIEIGDNAWRGEQTLGDIVAAVKKSVIGVIQET